MNVTRYCLVFALGFSLVAGCGDDDDGGGSIQSLCERGCRTEASLNCPNDSPSTCVSECVDGASGVPAECQGQANDALQCIVNLPASSWACDADGEGSPSEGSCTQQANALLTCVFDGECPFEDDDECDDPSGTGFCAAGTDVADCT